MGHEITRPKSLKRGMSGWEDWEKMAANVSYVPNSDSMVRTIVEIKVHKGMANTTLGNLMPSGKRVADNDLYEITLSVNNWMNPHYVPQLFSVHGRNPVYHPVAPTAKTEKILIHGNAVLGREADDWCFFSNGKNQRDEAEQKLKALGL